MPEGESGVARAFSEAVRCPPVRRRNYGGSAPLVTLLVGDWPIGAVSSFLELEILCLRCRIEVMAGQ